MIFHLLLVIPIKHFIVLTEKVAQRLTDVKEPKKNKNAEVEIDLDD